MSLHGKNILIFYPYGCTKHYGDSIRDELCSRGANVYSFDERPSQSSFSKILIRLFKDRIPGIFISYLKKIVKSLEGTHIDYVLVVRGEAFKVEPVKYLKSQFPSAKFILYLWDILQVNDQIEASKLYDKVLTFDENDAINNPHMIFRPTFFHPDFLADNCKKSTGEISDVLFIGTLNPYRYKLFCKLDEQLSSEFVFKKYFYIPSRIVLFKDRLRDRSYAKKYPFHFEPMGLFESIYEMQHTRSLIDVTYLSTGQSGLSMRAYEALASGVKYITTNGNICYSDFYDPNNILVLDPENPVFPKDFLESEFKPIPSQILQRYSIKTWVDDVFMDI